MSEIALSRQAEPVAELHSLAAEVTRRAAKEGVEREFLRQLLNRLDVAILVVGSDLRVTFVNSEACNLFEVEDPVGRALIEVCVEHHIVDIANRALTDQQHVQEEILLPPHRDAASKAERAFLIRSAPAHETGAWILLRDRTLQRQTEQLRRDFVANAAHELRTPMSVIRGYLEMLEESDAIPVTAKRPIEKMHRQSKRLSRLVEDMLTISRLENEPRLLRREPFKLADCANDAIEYLQPLIDQQEADAQLDFGDPDVVIDGDRFYWEQIFLNLLENALKHNQRAGLQLRIRHRARKKLKLDVIEVRDNGVGIPKRDLAHVFERFYRVDKHHSQATGGTGLGLSIVKRAVAAHGGEIQVESTPGHETKFIITLPR